MTYKEAKSPTRYTVATNTRNLEEPSRTEKKSGIKKIIKTQRETLKILEKLNLNITQRTMNPEEPGTQKNPGEKVEARKLRNKNKSSGTRTNRKTKRPVRT